MTEDNYCNWFDFTKLSKKEKDYLKRSVTNLGDTNSVCFKGNKKEEQLVCTKSIRCVPLEQIEEKPTWMKSRIEDIRKWADKETLNTQKLMYNHYKEEYILDIYDRHPRLSRDVDLQESKKDKFKISDGIHRIQRAKELNMDCILADVEECIIIEKN